MAYFKLILSLIILLSHMALADERRIKVAVVDTGLTYSKEIAPYLCEDGHKDFTGTNLSDSIGHGTNVAGLIAKGLDPKKHCLLILKWYAESGTATQSTAAFSWAIARGASYINFSGGGPAYSLGEHDQLQMALARGIRVSVAAGNGNRNLGKTCSYFPACYPFKSPNFYVVGSLNHDSRSWTSSYGGPVNAWAQGVGQTALGITMSGTSQATANWTGLLVQKETLK